MRGTRAAVLVAGLALVAGAAIVSARALDDSSGPPAEPASQGPSRFPADPTGDAADGPAGAAGGAGYGDEDSLAAVEDLLRRRADAVRSDDLPAFLATLDRADPGFVRQQRTTFENLQRLGVAEIRYGVDGRMLPVTPVSGDDPEIKPTVVEHVQIEGVDSDVTSHEVGFTFVNRDGTWLLGAERIDETQRTLSSIGVSRPWAEAPIAVRRQGPLTVVVDQDRADRLPWLVARAGRALTYVRGVLGVDNPAPLLVDATSSGAATRFSDRRTAVAGATFGPAMTMQPTGSTPIGVGGWRIKYNPDRLDLFLGDDRVLRHELTHFVLRDEEHPLWLMEGLAEHLGWRRTPIARLYAPASTYEQLSTDMPRDRFLTEREINSLPLVGYIGSQAVVEELASRRGLTGVLELVDTYDRLSRREVPDARADRVALEQVYATTEEEVAAAGHRRLMRIQHD